jgi:hypothetical protein
MRTEAEVALAEEVTDLVRKHQDAADLTYAQVLGVLEVVKAQVIEEFFVADEEEQEGEPNTAKGLA